MKQHKNIMKTLVYSEYGDQLQEKEKELEKKIEKKLEKKFETKLEEKDQKIIEQSKEIATLKQQLGK